MPSATVTSQGQITIPIGVRTAMRLRAGSRVVFTAGHDGRFEIQAESTTIRDLRGVVRATRPVTIEEMDQAIARSLRPEADE